MEKSNKNLNLWRILSPIVFLLHASCSNVSFVPGQGSIAIKVTDTEGRPISDCVLLLKPNDGVYPKFSGIERRWAKTDAHGMCQFPELGEDLYALELTNLSPDVHIR